MTHHPRPLWAASLLAAVLWLNPSPAAQAQNPIADYQFQNTYASSSGTVGPLTPTYTGNTFVSATVNGATQQVLNIPGQGTTPATENGVQTPANPFADQGVYSIVLLASFANPNIVGSGTTTTITKVFDFKNFTSDAGLYINGTTGLFQFIDSSSVPVVGGTSAAGVIVANTYYQLTLTRTAAGVLTAYQNGTQAFQFTDSSGLATLNTMLGIFKDNGVGTGNTLAGESTGGNLARLRLYNDVLTQAQVAALAPEPSTWALLLAGGILLGTVAFRRRRTA